MRTHNLPSCQRNSKRLSLLCVLSERDGKHSLARTTLVSNIFSWFQRRSSHSSSPVSDFTFLRLEFSNNFNASIIYMPGK